MLFSVVSGTFDYCPSNGSCILLMWGTLWQEVYMDEGVSRVLVKLGLDAKPFKQEKVIELVKNPLSGAWATVYSHHDAADGRPSVFACFADLTRKQEILAGDD